MSYTIDCSACGKPVTSDTTEFRCACGRRASATWPGEDDPEPEPKPLPGLDDNGDAEVRG